MKLKNGFERFKCILSIAILVIMAITGCGNKSKNVIEKGDTEVSADQEETYRPAVYTASEAEARAVPLGETFREVGVVSGELTYKVTGMKEYVNFEEAGHQWSEISEIENVYEDDRLMNEYIDGTDSYFDQNNNLKDVFRYVEVTYEAENQDAVGYERKTMFPVMTLCLADFQQDNLYMAVWFDGEKDSPKEGQPFYYTLEQGEDKTLTLGYIVLKSSVENEELKGLYLGQTVFDIK